MGKRPPDGLRALAAPRVAWDLAGDRITYGPQPMAEKKKGGRPGRKPPAGVKKQLLMSMDPDVIRRIKAAAALRESTASLVMEQAAKEWLEKHQDGKR